MLLSRRLRSSSKKARAAYATNCECEGKFALLMRFPVSITITITQSVAKEAQNISYAIDWIQIQLISKLPAKISTKPYASLHPPRWALVKQNSMTWKQTKRLSRCESDSSETLWKFHLRACSAPSAHFKFIYNLTRLFDLNDANPR